MIKKDTRRIREMIDAIKEAILHTEADLRKMSKEQFFSEFEMQRAVIFSLMVIGEPANCIMSASPKIKGNNEALWSKLENANDIASVLSMRHYERDLEAIWNTLNNQLSSLEIAIDAFNAALIGRQSILESHSKGILSLNEAVV